MGLLQEIYKLTRVLGAMWKLLLLACILCLVTARPVLLDTEDLAPLSLTKLVLVQFSVPRNKECRRLLPVWSRLARRYQDNTRVVIGQVNCEDKENLAQCSDQMMADKYPTIVVYEMDKEGEKLKYEGDHNLSALSAFIDSHLFRAG